MNLIRNRFFSVIKVTFYRQYSQNLSGVPKFDVRKEDPSLIRNIGILAHIDAGKTTTTERMLFYSGVIGQMGEVHHGNTVTDFMEQERERGITITSASVTFQWEKFKINLLDTPGHIDFTMEVEQTLNVMDGAVVIVDGSAGVEPQTITVWKQADRHKIPRIIYVNKMDKSNAEFFESIISVKKHFHITPLVLQFPIFKERNSSKEFSGVVDLLTLKKCEWNKQDLGKFFSQSDLNPKDGKLWETACQARIMLIETLADLDDKLAEIIILEETKLESISSDILKDSVRRITWDQKGVPVVCGSSYKNIGVQLLMDAVINYLPSPVNNQTSGKIMQYFGNNLCAKAFKVRHDKHKGPVIFLRIYSGTIKKGQKIYNVKGRKAESCGKLYTAYADDYEEISEIGVGNVAAVTGLKYTTTGELITSSLTACEKIFNLNENSLNNMDAKEVLFKGATIPEPVFFCSVEAPSQSQQAALEKALAELEREDPSLRVSVSEDTGQTILAGMGELHLEVIKERIREDYKIDVTLGPLQIAYKEVLIENVKDSHFAKHQIGETCHSVKITMSVLKSKSEDEECFFLDRSPEYAENISSIFPKHVLAVKKGVKLALASGPKLFCPVVNVKVLLHWLEVGRGTSESIITSTAAQCVKKLLKNGGTRLVEPIMRVDIVCSEDKLEAILSDLSKRKAELNATESRGTDCILQALVPLSQLLGYSRELRILSSGRASFSMEFHTSREMSAEDEAKAVKSVTGFDN